MIEQLSLHFSVTLNVGLFFFLSYKSFNLEQEGLNPSQKQVKKKYYQGFLAYHTK